MLALCGFLGYVLVYTMWLKRKTPQNIVIGGAAGAVPPLVGWAAVTGSVDPAAWYLFAIVFYWTPPHFWALSLLMKDEYARVGVPMMPVVHGEVETRRQILLYTCLLVVLTMLPVVFGFFGAIYAVAALGLGGAFLVLARAPAAPRRPRQRAAHLPVLARVPGRAVLRDGRRRAAPLAKVNTAGWGAREPRRSQILPRNVPAAGGNAERCQRVADRSAMRALQGRKRAAITPLPLPLPSQAVQTSRAPERSPAPAQPINSAPWTAASRAATCAPP